jgi:alginate O-acetyltransferase complex protein AlgI
MNETTTVPGILSLALWMAGAGHFVLLLAGGQLPSRLNWKSDLAKLHPFNRKLLWTYWAFTGLTLVAFGMLTLLLHEELLAGDRSALALAAFIAVFWAARIGVDAFYFSHHDWPEGAQFVVGHVLLTGLFLFLLGTYVGLLGWHLLRT